jgi:RNA polymerase sigma-70 factor, ECF subfamily
VARDKKVCLNSGNLTDRPAITRLLFEWGKGDEAALQALIPLVYEELRRIAKGCLAGERRGNGLSSSDLVHEAYLRLIDAQHVDWQNRAHFFAVAARLMRRVLVDLARRKRSLKRGGGVSPISFDDALEIAPETGPDLSALDDALLALAAFDERKSRVVELRFFGGLNAQETASVLRVSVDTVKRDWKFARAWLMREMRAAASAGQPAERRPAT